MLQYSINHWLTDSWDFCRWSDYHYCIIDTETVSTETGRIQAYKLYLLICWQNGVAPWQWNSRKDCCSLGVANETQHPPPPPLNTAMRGDLMACITRSWAGVYRPVSGCRSYQWSASTSCKAVRSHPIHPTAFSRLAPAAAAAAAERWSSRDSSVTISPAPVHSFRIHSFIHSVVQSFFVRSFSGAVNPLWPY